MRLAPCLLILAAAAASPAAARPSTGEASLAVIREDVASGRIDAETGLLESLRLVFAPERTDDRYVPEARTPLRCLTPVLIEYRAQKAVLSSATVREIEGYLARGGPSLRATYFSPSGTFELTYTTSGVDAVPATDVNPANGIPDFVERCAEYADESWTVTVDDLGFMAPLLPGDGTYDIFFENMGAYGFTSVAGSTTEITIDNNFVGFPPNDDPDGDQLGAAKVTIAHELKHASQYTNNGWSEDGWVELDATWMEDIVYDVTNDYYNYINFSGAESQLVRPWLSLEEGGTGSYEDCIWEHYLTEKHGNQFMVDLYDRRRSFPSENMKTSYQQILGTYASNWDEAYPEYLDWCWFTGTRAEPPYGFGESTTYRRMELRGPAIAAYPFALPDSVDHLAAHPRRFNPGSPALSPRVLFDGLDSHTNFTVSVIVSENAGGFTITHPAVGAGNVVDYTVPLPWSSIEYVGVIVTNSKRTGGVATYSLEVSEVTGSTGAEIATGTPFDRMTLLPNTPNPFVSSTWIRFAVPSTTRGSLKIVDVAGRVVRTLVDGSIAAGRGEIAWDARNQAGRQVPAGVYWARLETPEGSVARKIMVVR